MDFAELRRLWDPMSTSAGAAIGVLGLRLWDRYINRIAVFRWSHWHNRLAVAGTDPTIGTVAVLVNGTAVANLQFCNIEFENQSGRDFENVEIKFWYEDLTYFVGEGTVYGLTQHLPWSNAYAANLQRISQIAFEDRTKADRDYTFQRREYVIPVFNRNTKFSITFVVRPFTDMPALRAACDHPGVRLHEHQRRQMFFGVVGTHAAWTGVVAAMAMTVVTATVVSSPAWAATIGLVAGALSALIGAGLIHLRRWIVRTIG